VEPSVTPSGGTMPSGIGNFIMIGFLDRRYFNAAPLAPWEPKLPE